MRLCIVGLVQIQCKKTCRKLVLKCGIIVGCGGPWARHKIAGKQSWYILSSLVFVRASEKVNVAQFHPFRVGDSATF